MSHRILLVDDSVTNRLLVKAYFVGTGFEFVEAANGREGLTMLRARPPHLVICDVFMPGLSGWDFVRAVRSDARAEVSSVPVILASSKRGEEVQKKSLEAGADAFLPKPLAGEQLLGAVRGLIARGSRAVAASNGSRSTR